MKDESQQYHDAQELSFDTGQGHYVIMVEFFSSGGIFQEMIIGGGNFQGM